MEDADIQEEVARARRYIQQRQGGVPPGMTDLQALVFFSMADPETVGGALDHSKYRNTLNAKDGTGMTALMYAAQAKQGEDTSLVRELLRAGADPSIRNADGKTALDLFRETYAQAQAELRQIREGHLDEIRQQNLNPAEQQAAEQALAEMHAGDDEEIEAARQWMEDNLRVAPRDVDGGRKRRKTKLRKAPKRKTLRRRRVA